MTNISTTTTRIAWVDFYKSVAIFSVVILHIHMNEGLDTVINSYVMPVFFGVSGYLFSYDRNPKFKPFIRKRFRQILFPYIWIGLTAYLLWLFILRHFGDNPDDNLAWYIPLLGTIGGVPPLIVQDIPLWSLFSFFCVEAVYYPLRRICKSDTAVLAVFVVLSCLLYYFFPSEVLCYFPFALAPAIFGGVFYAFGHMAARLADQYDRLRIFSLPLLIVGIAIQVVVDILNGHTAFYICDFGSLPLFLAGGIGGILTLYQLSLLVSRYIGDKIIIVLISKNTLLICGFHLLVFAFLKGVAMFCGISPSLFSSDILAGIFMATLIMVISLAVSVFITRKLFFLVDKK